MIEQYLAVSLAFFALLSVVYVSFYRVPRRAHSNFRAASNFKLDFKRGYYFGSSFFTLFGVSLGEGKVIFANYLGHSILEYTEIADWLFNAVPATDKEGRFTIKYTMRIVPKSPERQTLKLDGLSKYKIDELEQIKIQFVSAMNDRVIKQASVEIHTSSTDHRVQRAIDKLREANFSPDDRLRKGSDKLERLKLGVQILVDECEVQFGKYDGKRDRRVLIEALGEFFLRRESDSGDIGHGPDSLRTLISNEVGDYLRSKR